MTVELSFVLVALIICVTILTWKCIDVYSEHRVSKANSLTEYWKGRYYALSKAFDVALKVELQETSLDEVARFLTEKFE